MDRLGWGINRPDGQETRSQSGCLACLACRGDGVYIWRGRCWLMTFSPDDAQETTFTHMRGRIRSGGGKSRVYFHTLFNLVGRWRQTGAFHTRDGNRACGALLCFQSFREDTRNKHTEISQLFHIPTTCSNSRTDQFTLSLCRTTRGAAMWWICRLPVDTYLPHFSPNPRTSGGSHRRPLCRAPSRPRNL